MAIGVGARHSLRITRRLADLDAVRAFLWWLVDARTGSATPPFPLLQRGALVSPSARDHRPSEPRSTCRLRGARFYGGFCNRALWPLFHGFPGRVCYTDADWQAYVDANAEFARHGMFLHIPFPACARGLPEISVRPIGARQDLLRANFGALTRGHSRVRRAAPFGSRCSSAGSMVVSARRTGCRCDTCIARTTIRSSRSCIGLRTSRWSRRCATGSTWSPRSSSSRRTPRIPASSCCRSSPGAAVELVDAVITNPYHADGLAADLDQALRMGGDERAQRYARMAATLVGKTPQSWAAAFRDRLNSAS